MRKITLTLCSCALVLAAMAADPVGVSPGPGVRYATDAYPGFDRVDDVIKPEKKTPHWFWLWFGVKYDTPAEQLKFAEDCEAHGSFGRAERAYDALVAKWPMSPEALTAQRKLADLYLADDDPISAEEEYRYLLDFFSSRCNYAEIADILYKVCERMREEGKTVVFFHFANTVDVRRAYEALVLHSPGADFVPAALMTIAQLRRDDLELKEAVAVYENLRNLFPKAPEAKEARFEEAHVRMELIEKHAYNRDRINDTIKFLRQSVMSDCTIDQRLYYSQALNDAKKALDAATYNGNKYYDSVTRTRRSAIHAYQLYLEEYPEGEHADEARTRLNELLILEASHPSGAQGGTSSSEDFATINEKPINEIVLDSLKDNHPAHPQVEMQMPELGAEPDWLKDYMKKRELQEKQQTQTETN